MYNLLYHLLTFAMTIWNAPITYRSPRYIRKLFREFHPDTLTPSVEHCVPKSLFKDRKVLGQDMHNLLSMPRDLNSHRSNFKLMPFGIENASVDTSWKHLREWDAWKCTKQRLFVPPDAYKGRYARSIGYFALVYPPYQECIRTMVLDPRWILEWSSDHPPSDSERRFHETISQLQGNENPLMVPSCTQDALHELHAIFHSTNYAVYENLETQFPDS